MITIPIISIKQPIGTFYMGVLNANVISLITNIVPRKFNFDNKSYEGIQRKLSSARVNDIAKYCSDPDAIFPTPIIIALYNTQDYKITDNELIIYNDNVKIGEIIDGQHRLRGIENSGFVSDFNLPVVFMYNLEEEDKAYIFSTINGTQTKVSMSLISDLFDISKQRSPQKTCHDIAKLFNNDHTSPFYKRLKMLGNKESELESLSQGSFIEFLMPLISLHPERDMIDLKNNEKLNEDLKCPLRHYFINEQDDIIYKIIFNLFSAVKDAFPLEWNDPNEYILSKTTGYAAILKSFNMLYNMGTAEKDLSKEFFDKKFLDVKNQFIRFDITLTSQNFPSNRQTQQKLSNYIIKAINHEDICPQIEILPLTKTN